MDRQIQKDFEKLCVQDEAPACQSTCPIHLEARTFVRLMAENNFKKARIELDRYMPLSSLCAFLCEGECQKACKRAQIGEAINMPMLERACVLNTEATKIMPLPSNNKKIAIAGSSLSSLCLAWELGKKGFSVTLFHAEKKGEIGKELLAKAGKKLPKSSIEQSLEILSSLKVEYSYLENFDSAWLDKALEEHLIVYLGEDDNNVASAQFNIEKINNSASKSSVSLLSSRENLLAGGYSNGEVNFCKAMVDAKKATGSIVRILQNVSPEVARESEAPYETKLFTSLEAYEHLPQVECENPLMPSLLEANEEAKRCIQCTCLLCVKECAFMQKFNTYPKRASLDAFNNLAISLGSRTSNSLINSCAQCGLCAKICPNGLDLGKFLEEIKKELVQKNFMPPTAHEFALEDMAFSNSKEIQFYREQINSSKNSNKYVFFPGCQLPTVLPKEVEKTYTYLTNNLEGGVALHFACCGMPASWASSTTYLENHIECIKKEWEERKKPAYIFACASCQSFYQKYIPEMQIYSLWEILVETSFIANNTSVKPDLKNFALHDPCTSRAFPKMQESVRALLSSLGQEFEELDFGRENTRCCGFGGLLSEVNQELGDVFASERNNDTTNSLLVYCAICRERMQKVGKNSLHLLEILFSTEDLNERKEKSLLSIHTRQENRIQFRQEILKVLWKEENESLENTKDIEYKLANGVEEILSQRRILHSDIIQVLQDVEENGASFYSAENETYLACYRPRQVTFWVKYAKKENMPYIILDAYSHRMIVPGVKGEDKLPTFKNFSCCE